jgi:hypothetical protein
VLPKVLPLQVLAPLEQQVLEQQVLVLVLVLVEQQA